MIKKLFCRHVWKTHAKKVYTWEETLPVEGTAHWFKPKFNNYKISETREVLICEKCGKIHKVTY